LTGFPASTIVRRTPPRGGRKPGYAPPAKRGITKIFVDRRAALSG